MQIEDRVHNGIKLSLIGLDSEELRVLMQKEGEEPYRGSQLADYIYNRGARTFDEMSSLPAALRARLSEKYVIGRSKTVAVQRSADGTVKLLSELFDGERIETVGLPYLDRYSCCLSTQVGCSIGCSFCASGRNGFTRNLTAGEIVEQVLAVRDVTGHRIDHVVFMGMGEPLINYDATVKAVLLLNTELKIAARHLTVSTSGYVPGIRKLAKEQLQITLAVSLHAATDELRRKLIPRMGRWAVAEIIDACREYLIKTGRRVTIEYCLLDGVNDSIAGARELARVLQGLNCHVNLIPYNAVSGLSFRASSAKRARGFLEVLRGAGVQATKRLPRGTDIDAACGQLRCKKASKT